jgi:hypothetical protein
MICTNNSQSGTVKALNIHSKEKAKSGKNSSDRPKGREGECKPELNNFPLPYRADNENERYVPYQNNGAGEISSIHADFQDYGILGSFFQRPYFSRRWIIQEISLARRIVIYCGGTVLYTAVEEAMFEVVRLPNCRRAGREGAVATAEMIGLNKKIGVYPSSMKTLSSFPRFQCQDERDHVFAMIGVFEATLTTDKHFAPDHMLRIVSYSSGIDAVYMAMAQYQLSFDSESANIELLSLAGAMKHTATASLDQAARVTSWVPDWRNILDTSIIQLHSYGMGRNYQTSGRRTGHTNRKPEGGLKSYNLAWASLHMPFRFVNPQALQIYGLEIDTIDDTIQTDLSKHADRVRLQSWLDNGQFGDYSCSVCGSLLEAVSASLVHLCHVGFWSDHVTWWVQENRKRLFDAFEHKHGHDAPEFQEFLRTLPEIMRGRCFVRTRSGYFGIGSRYARPGHKVVLPVRSPLVFILRDLVSRTVPPAEEGAVAETTVSRHALFGPYELIGDMYMHAFNFASINAFAPKSLLIY